MNRPMILIILLVLVAFISAIEVNCVTVTDYPAEEGLPIGVCMKGQYIYVTGFNQSPSGAIPLMKRYDVRDGSLIETLRTQVMGIGWPTDCVVSGHRLYVVGHVNETWSIFSLNLDLDNKRENKSLVRGVPLSVTSDGQFLYVAGYDKVGIDGERWRVEWRNIGNLSLIGVYPSSNVKYVGRAVAIRLNPVTRQLWVVGYNSTDWHIEILRRNLSRVAVIRPDVRGRALGVVFDEEGNAYVYGIGGVIKYDADNRELARAISFNVSGAVYVNGTLFIVTMDNWLVISDKNLREINRVDLSPEVSKCVNVKGNVRAEKAVSDGKVLYVAGRVRLENSHNWKWVIYAVSLPKPVQQSAETVKIPTGSMPPLGSSSTTQTSTSIISSTSPLASNISDRVGGGGLFPYFMPLIVVIVVIAGLVVWGFVLRRPRIERVGGVNGDFCI